MPSVLFDDEVFEDTIKSYNRKRVAVDVPEKVLEELRDAQTHGKYKYWAVKDPSQYEIMANVLRSGGDLLENASVLVKPVIRDEGAFHVVSDSADATHIRATVSLRRGFKPGSRTKSK